jgi:hypothetical protein
LSKVRVYLQEREQEGLPVHLVIGVDGRKLETVEYVMVRPNYLRITELVVSTGVGGSDQGIRGEASSCTMLAFWYKTVPCGWPMIRL